MQEISKPKGFAKLWREIKRPFRKIWREIKRPFKQFGRCFKRFVREMAGFNELNQTCHDLHNDLRNECHSLQHILQNESSNFHRDLYHNLNCLIQSGISISNLHQKIFPKYKNIHHGKEVVIVATGPSLNDYVPIKNAIHIGVNSAFQFDRVALDYLFAIDYLNIRSYIAGMNKYRKDECKKFYGLFRNHSHPMHISESHVIEANAERFYINYNDYEYDEKLYYDISNFPLASFWTVTFQAIQFALWTFPKTIYLVGCDESDLGHFNEDKREPNIPDLGQLEFKRQILTKHMDGWMKLKEFAGIYYPETNIVSINPIGLKGVFESL